MEKRFDDIARFFTSLQAVIIGLLLLIGFMVFETQTLFYNMLPDMGEAKRLIASVLVAIVFEFSVLITTANSNHLSKKVPVVLAVCGFFLIVWFWRAWEGSAILVFYKFFVSALQAYLNYLYSDLFLSKWNEKGMLADINDIERKMDQKLSQYDRIESELNEINSEIDDANQLLNDKIRKLDENTCPHCGDVMNGTNGLNAHVGRCKENPNAVRKIAS